jgi:hypothetical protein
MQCDRDGNITYPDGCNDIWETLDRVEAKLNARYVTEREKEHQHQLQPMPTNKSIYTARENKRILQRIENICLVKAYFELKTWKDRVKYLAKCGYEYTGAPSTVWHRLQNRVEDLTTNGEWAELVKVVEGK